MKRVFLDTNVLLDVLRNRTPFVRQAHAVWLLAERGTVTGLVSTLSFTNIYYIIRKCTDEGTAMQCLRQLRAILAPVACDTRTIDQALASGFADFEDAIQYFSARSAGAECLLTRDARHFPAAAIPVLSPEQFLAIYHFE